MQGNGAVQKTRVHLHFRRVLLLADAPRQFRPTSVIFHIIIQPIFVIEFSPDNIYTNERLCVCVCVLCVVCVCVCVFKGGRKVSMRAFSPSCLYGSTETERMCVRGGEGDRDRKREEEGEKQGERQGE